jgi:TPR repeat protein
MVSKKSTTAEVWPGSTVVAGLIGAGQNEGMKKALLFVLALAVIPVGVDAQAPDQSLVRAAERGEAGAQFVLGTLYAEGDGVPEDDVEAVRWFRLAAEQGDAFYQTILGSKYANGRGVPTDQVLAYMWYNLAAAQGYENAQSNKDTIEGLMTREQIAEAQRLSREWIEAHPPGGN